MPKQHVKQTSVVHILRDMFLNHTEKQEVKKCPTQF